MVKKFEVVISGISGVFPECTSIKELETKTYAGENLITRDESMEMKIGDKVKPLYVGPITDTREFDHAFFGVHPKVMNTENKFLIKGCYEAICDAGINPKTLKGSKTAVYTTNMISESTEAIVSCNHNTGSLLAYASCMNANRISYFFNLTGPSANLLSSWTGSIEVVQTAARMVETGEVKMAIVGGMNKMFVPFFNVQYDGIKHLNSDGKTKSFSADADGYNRSDSCVVMVLQRAEDARRSYGSIVKVMSSHMLSQPSHLCDPMGFGSFIKDFYSDVDINRDDIAYIECDGSASKNVDAAELNGLSEALCTKRKRPLLVGSCKSRIGHSEAAAGLVSLAQALIAMKNGIIPSTLHYTAPNPDVPALLDGTIKVVTENTPLEGDYVGVSVISMVNGYGHALIKRNPKTKAKSLEYFPADNIPRIFLLSGRNIEAMDKILNSVLEKPVDENYYALNHNVFKDSIPNHLLRGFTIKGKDKTSIRSGTYSEERRPIWYIFTGMGCQWPGMGAGLMKIPVIRRSLERSAKVLATKGFDLMNVLTTLDPTSFQNILNSFVGIAAIQIALADLLEELGFVPDGYVGHSTGEIGCAYADKCLTAEQAILAAYGRGKSSIDAKLIKGMMAAVGMGYNQIKDSLPDGIHVACHNSSTSCTLSGPAEIMEEYVAKLKKTGVMAKLVNVSNIAYHTEYIQPASAPYLRFLEEVIPEPTLRSSKWISSSVPEDKWDTFEGRHCSSQYFVKNLLNPVLFEEATQHVPKNAICIEVAPHGLLQGIVKASMPECIHVPLTHWRDNGTFFLIEALGSMFMQGVDIDMSKLYPPVDFPVPRETDFLDVITWYNVNQVSSDKYYCDIFIKKCGFRSECWKPTTLYSTENEYAQNNMFRGASYYPKSNLLMTAMEMEKENVEASKLRSYSFQNLTFNQDLPFHLSDDKEILFMLQPATHNFEVLHDNDFVMSGCLTTTHMPLPDAFMGSNLMESQCKQVALGENDIYAIFEEMGYNLMPPFRNITALVIFDSGVSAKVEWKNNFELYLESIFKVIELYESIRADSVLLLHTVDRLLVDPESLPKEHCQIDVYYDSTLKYLSAQGIRLYFSKTKKWTPDSSSSCEMKTKLFSPQGKVDFKAEVSLKDCEFIDMGDAGKSSEAVMKQQLVNDKIRYHVYRYRFLSDVMTTIKLPYYKSPNIRLVFYDESCERFNANKAFYKQQLLKGLKLNIAMKGVWGSLKDNSLACISQSSLIDTYPLGSVRCSSVNLEVIAINLKSLVYPDKYRKIGVIEYSGVKNGTQVFGLGRLVEGNYLETDPALCWEKPKHWSMEDAATIPLYYTMAYDILEVRNRETGRWRSSLLIHAGHTPFSQVVIKVALSLQIQVFTTCYSTLQKQVILKKFPKLKENNVTVIQGGRDDSFAENVMKTTAGKGPYIVIDNLESTSLRTETARCSVDLGSYYLLTTDDMDHSFIFGMNLLYTNFGMIGYNPEMIFDMKDEDKLMIGELIQEGIKSEAVKPLMKHPLPSTFSPSQTADIIVEKSREDFPGKFIMPLKKHVPAPNRKINNERSALIIGDDKGLWFDLVKWLVSKGVNSVHVLLNQHRVSHNLILRFSEFALKHKYTNLTVGELEKLDSLESWSELIKSFQPVLDSVFYIDKGTEDKLGLMETSLRASGTDTCLFTFGSHVSHESNLRHREGLRTVSFILTSEKLENLSVINCLDHWLDKCTANDHIIEVHELNDENQISEEKENILPKCWSDLVELGRCSSDEPGLVEVVTRCQLRNRAHDVDPVILFPGLQLNKTRRFASRLIYPTFMATYPSSIKSIHQLASAFAENLVQKFDNNMFTLVAEGWAGPLVLTIATLLEKHGKASSVLLLNAGPLTTKQWKKQQDGFLANLLPSDVQCEMNTDALRRHVGEVSRSLCNGGGPGNQQLIEKEVDAGLEILISRLNAVENYSTENHTLRESCVHLFSPNDIVNMPLFKMCSHFYRQISVKTPGCILEDKSLIDNINELVILDSKAISKRPDTKDVSTLKILYEKVVRDHC